MKTIPHVRLMVLSVSAALAQIAAAPVMADSGIGVDAVIGNALNPGYSIGFPVLLDPDTATGQRTPSGQLYQMPKLPSEDPPTKTEGGWEYSGAAEIGILGGAGSKAQKFREYKDLKNGLYLNNFNLSMEKPGNAYFFDVQGGGVARDDQYYSLSFGRYNDWKVKAFYNETPHVFTTTFKPIFTNNGSSSPTVDNGTPGGAGAATQAQLQAYARTLSDTEVGLIRRKGGVRLDLNLTDNWKTYMSASPFGYQGSAAEGIEPIDYKTIDLLAGVTYADKLTTFGLKASASFFKNDIDYLFVRNTTKVANAAPTNVAAIDYDQYTLAPDNKAFSLKGDFSRKFPEFYKGRLSASYAWTSSQQDDAIRTPIQQGLALPTQAAGAGGAVFNVNNWNGVNGSPTSRSSSGLRVDSHLYNLSLSLNPLDDLNVKGTIRHYETKNKSGTYYAYNPLTGEWGYGVQEGAFNTLGVTNGAGGCQPAPGFTMPAGATCVGIVNFAANPRSYFSPPRDVKQTNYTLDATYDLGPTASLEGSIEREEFKRTYRERDKTWENKYKLTYVNRGITDMTLRASYEQDNKRGSFYDPLVTTRSAFQDWMAFYGISYSRAALVDLISKAGTGGIYPTLVQVQTALAQAGGQFNSGGFMKTDQADRDQNILNVRVNYMAQENLDVGGMVQVKRVRYPGNAWGVQKDDLNTYNIDFNYQPSAATQLTGYYSRQEGKQRQIESYVTATAAQQIVACGPNTIAGLIANLDCFLNNQRVAGSDVAVDTKNTNDTWGLGFSHDFGNVQFTANYNYSKGVTEMDHAFGIAALTPAQATTQAALGKWPNVETTAQALDLNLLIPINKQTSARLMYRHENMKFRDWHYDYLVNSAAFLVNDAGPSNYKVDVIGLFLNVKM